MSREISHVCLFRLRRELLDADRRELDRYAEEILRSLEGVRRYRFVANRSRKAGGFDLVLDSCFASEAELRAYVQTPLHDELARYMDGLVEQTIVADY
ncbi:MAG: Dabb family protein [Reyranellaceae bacterium]